MGKPIKNTTGAVAPNTAKSAQTKMLGIMLGGLIVLLALVFFLTTQQQQQVEVVTLNQAVMTGDVITEDMLVKYNMLKKTYDEMGVQSFTDEEGNKVQENVYILWKDREEKAVNMTVSNYVKDGSVLTTRDLTTKQVSRNPWLEGIDPEDEIYTMSFDAGGVNSRLLMPGTRIRARLVYNVPVEDLNAIRNEITGKEESSDEDSIVSSSVLMGYGSSSQTPQFDENGNLISYGSSTLSGEVAVAEIVIDNITIADMRNGDGESIFEIYSSLVKMPLAERMAYLTTSVSDPDTATDFQNRLTPVDLTFIVDKESANMLAEFENTEGATLKYTILPGYGTDISESALELVQQFGEVSNQISSAGTSSGVAAGAATTNQ